MIQTDTLHVLEPHEFIHLATHLDLIPFREKYTPISNESKSISINSKLNLPLKLNFASQTFSNYKSSLTFPPSLSEWRRLKQKKIQLLLMTSQASHSNPLLYHQVTRMLSLLTELCQAFFYGCEVSMVTDLPIENTKATTRIHPGTKRIQYLAPDLIHFLKKKRQTNVFAVIGVTFEDLFPDFIANFVLGHANFKGGSGIISFGKYSDESDGILRLAPSKLFWRLTKVLIHELTHTFGLAHCYDFACLMNASGNTPEAESQTLFLCPLCLSKLQHVLRFDLSERYRAVERALLNVRRLSQEFVSVCKGRDEHFALYHLGIGAGCDDKERCEKLLRDMDVYARQKWDDSIARLIDLNQF